MRPRVLSNLGVLTLVALALAAAFRVVVARFVDAEIVQISSPSFRFEPVSVTPASAIASVVPDPPVASVAPVAVVPSASAIEAVAKPPIARVGPRAPSLPLVRHVTRAEVDAAIERGVGGASLHLVRDETGAPIGLKIKSTGDLAVLGVQAGDILVSANGLPIDTPDRALAALGKLRDARALNVVFRRGDATYALTADVE